MITVMVPTRGRPEQISRLMDAFFELTDDLNDVQFVIGCDEDEIALAHKYGQAYVKRCNFKVTVDKETTNISLKANRMFQTAIGDIIMILNDDMVCRTKGWDTIVKDRVKQYPDQIYLIYGRDGIQDEKLCCWQITSRFVIKTVRYIWHPLMPHLYQDNWNYDMFKQIGRLIYVPELFMEHMHWGQGKAQKDATYDRCDSPVGALTEYHQLKNLRETDAAKLKKFIKEGNSNANQG